MLRRQLNILSARTCFYKTSVIRNVSKSNLKRKKLRDSIVYDVKTGVPGKQLSAYVFGLSATGALGLERLLIPKDGKMKTTMGVLHPLRLSLFGSKRLIPLDVACGYGFTMFICGGNPDGRLSVYGCGVNSDGQLGQIDTLKGIFTDSLPPTDSAEDVALTVHIVPTPTHISIPVSAEEMMLQPTHMACGRAHSMVALQSSSPSSSDQPPLLFSFGNNTFGQCGRPVVDGEIFGPESAVVTRVSLPKNIGRIKQLCCGQDHTLLLTEDGVVYSSGLGSDGQTGLGTFSSVDQFTRVTGPIQDVPIVQLASRGDTVLALARNSQLFAWGNNEYGQLWPAGDQLQVSRPVELPLHRCLVPPEVGDSMSGLRIQRIRSIACAGSNCALVDEAGHVFVWGFGCLGLGPDTTHAPLPTLLPPGLFLPAKPGSLVSIASGLHHYLLRSSAGHLWAWGAPRSGLFCLGLGRQMSDLATQRQTYPLPVSLPGEVVHLECGVDHSVVLVRGLA